MSMSVDDLVASFSANHIGQEASELAAFKTQLQALLVQSSTAHSFSRGHAQPVNTPTRTPSGSMCWDPRELARSRSTSVSSIGASQLHGDHTRLDDDMDEDERVVEDMLFSPSASVPPASGQPFIQRHARTPSAYDFAQELPSANTGLFATTDPFLAAQLQAAQSSSTSAFAQAGRPSPHSPFLAHTHARQFPAVHAFAHSPVSPEVEAHNRFATSTAAF